MAYDSEVWKCHPDLMAEWEQFVNDSRRAVGNDLHSDLWMNFWRSEVQSTKSSDAAVAEISLSVKEPEETPDDERSTHYKSQPMEACEEMQVDLLPQEAILSESQLKQLKSICCELTDALDMPSGNIPDDLQDDVRMLLPHETEFVFRELQSKLSDQGIYTFCSLLTEDANAEPWTDISLVFKVLFLDKLKQDGFKSCNQELVAGIKQLTEHFPSECVSSFLKPLLTSELSPPYLQLVAGLMPLLPERDFSSLLEYVVLICTEPLEEQQISILNSLLSGVQAHSFKSRPESPLIKLLPILSASARNLSARESFATLLLKIIPILKKNLSPQIYNELLAIIQINTSFNSKALMDALLS